MQSILVGALLMMFSIYAFIQNRHEAVTMGNSYAQFKADAVAGNIIEYCALLTRYILVNYDNLHMPMPMPTATGKTEQVSILNYNAISSYSQKLLVPFFNYQSVTFNYTRPGDEDTTFPTLFLVVSWSEFTPGSGDHKISQMPEVMGAAGQLLGRHIYQGASTYWSLPILLQQDNNCNMLEIFSQVPDSVGGSLIANKIGDWFHNVCVQVQSISSYRFLTYVYLAPVVLPAG